MLYYFTVSVKWELIYLFLVTPTIINNHKHIKHALFVNVIIIIFNNEFNTFLLIVILALG